MRALGAFAVTAALALALGGSSRPSHAAAATACNADNGVCLDGPADGSSFVLEFPAGKVTLQFHSNWYWTGGDSTLRVFVGSSPGATDLFDQSYTCAASGTPNCRTSLDLTNLRGTYYWGIQHNFPSGVTGGGTSPIWSFSVRSTQCSDGADNDGDGKVDYPADPGCSSLADDDETNSTTSTTTVATTTTTSSTTTSTTTAAPADRDRDGIVDTSDACPDTAAGSFDPNRNGCPGPWPQIKPKFGRSAVTTSQGRSYIAWLAVSHVPPGATVAFHAGRFGQTVAAARTGAARITKIGQLVFGDRATYSIKVTAPNWIGYYGVFVVPAGRAPHPIQEQCVRVNGKPTPVRCSTVDRGR